MKLGVCKHYRGPVAHTECRAGVNYAKLTRSSGLVMIRSMPCIEKNTTDAVCDKRDLPTPEEVEQYEREVDELITFANEAYTRCATHAQANGFVKGQHGLSGEVECPKCSGVLKYSIEKTRGHIWAKCTTKTCDVTWVQ